MLAVKSDEHSDSAKQEQEHKRLRRFEHRQAKKPQTSSRNLMHSRSVCCEVEWIAQLEFVEFFGQ
eukprot:5017412-Amphidinium_carterae.1